MTADRPYSRHYHDLIDDAKFEEVYPNDQHYACWSRLLMIADQAWPASAHLPATARRASVKKLAEVGLIDLLPDGRYRMHGLQKERERRQDHARTASNARWNAPSISRGNAGAYSGGMPRREENRRDETSIAREHPQDDSSMADMAWSDACGKTLLGSGQYAQDYIEDAVRRHGEQLVAKTIVEARNVFDYIPAPQPLAVAVRNLLDPLPSGKDTAAAEAAKREEIRSRRAVEGTIRTAHKTGFHDETADPRCPLCKEGP